MKTLKEALITTGVTLATLLNINCLTPKMIEYSSLLTNVGTNLNHLLAGTGVPCMFSLMEDISNANVGKSVKFLAYVAGSIFWETKEAAEKGCCQLDHIMYDVLGVSIYYLIDKNFISK